MSDLTPQLVFALIRSNNSFPVDFDDAWSWVGYSTKQKAKDKLTRNFEKGIDYVLLNHLVKQTGQGGHNLEPIRLTVDCFKSFCMMAGTKKGREVRRYFLRCESELRQRIENERNNPTLETIERLYNEEFQYYQQRIALRKVLQHDQTPELSNTLDDWSKKTGTPFGVRGLCNIYNEINVCIQSLTSKQIKQHNNLPERAAIRDRFGVMTLDDYSAITRIVINLVRYEGLEPKDAVTKAAIQWLGREYTPSPAPLEEDVKKMGRRLRRQGKLLQAARREYELLNGVQLSLNFEQQAS